MADGYREWDAEPAAAATDAPPAGYKEYDPASTPTRDWMDYAGGAGKGALYGAGAGAGTYLLRGLFRRAFPGSFPTASALKRIDAAIKASDSKSGLKPMMSRYMQEVSTSNKPLTFADFLAAQPGHTTATKAVEEMVANSGNIPAIEEKLATRSAGAKARVLDDISGALGVPKESVIMGKDRLIADRSTKAQPLYDTAFADDTPIKDSRFFKLFEAPASRKALSEAMTNAENRLQPMDVRSAANPRRKDWWKFASQDDVPEGLFVDEEGANGLRRYIAPNMRNADSIQKSLRSMMEASMKEDPVTKYMKHTDKSRALSDLHKQFMQTMYDVAPNDAYRQARQSYAGDSKLLDAHRMGSELLTMKPDEVRKAVKSMSPDERTALAQGFYGAVNDMKAQKMTRELIGRPERYPEHREVLSAVFQDPVKLDQFLENLRGEEAMSDSFARYGSPPPSKDNMPRLPWLRVSDTPFKGADGLDISGAGMTGRVIGNISPHLGWPSRRASKAGTDFLFRDPQLFGYGASHPDWNTVNKTPMSPLERAIDAGKFAGAGTAGGLGIYGASQLGE